MKMDIIKKATVLIATLGLMSCTTSKSAKNIQVAEALPSNQSTASTQSNGYHTSLWEGGADNVWNKLHHMSSAKLTELQSTTTDPMQSAWITLALISKHQNIPTSELVQQLSVWRTANPTHPGNQLIPDDGALSRITGAGSPPKQIAIFLPESGAYGASGQMVKEGFLNAFYASTNKYGKQNVKFYDTAIAANMKNLYQKAIAEGADFIIGPLLRPHVEELNLAASFNVPIVALNYTNGNLRNNFYEFGLLPEDEAAQLADRAYEDGRMNALVIAPQNEWGKRLVAAFSKRWQSYSGSIQDSLYFSAKTEFNKEIAALLKVVPGKATDEYHENGFKRRQDFDVIFLFAQPQDARVIVPLLRYYYVNNTPVYATSSVYSGKPNVLKDVDLDGIIVCDIPWQKTNANSHDRLYAVGQDAYRLTQNLERLATLKNFPLYGTTGALTMADDHKIHRHLPCTSVKNGLL